MVSDRCEPQQTRRIKMKLTNKFGDVVEIVVSRCEADDEGNTTYRCQKFEVNQKTGSVSSSWMYLDDPEKLVEQVASLMRQAGWK